MIEIPPPFAALDSFEFVVSLSGGKDSAATSLALREAGIKHRLVFADTGWEAPETYAYLDTLRALLGPIDVVRAVRGGMLDIAAQKAGFPMRQGRWCTEKLKVEPLKAYRDTIEREGREVVSVVGIRAEESEERAKFKVWEDCERWGGWVWRPILHWPIEEVLAIHHRHGVPVNPLYKRGHNRVGCYPCIMANKDEVRLVAEHAPDRIALIRAKESEFSAERVRRNAAGEGNFEHLTATFFSPKAPGVSKIDEVVAWSRTDRGGKQLPMFKEPPDGGCFRWGFCEAPEGSR